MPEVTPTDEKKEPSGADAIELMRAELGKAIEGIRSEAQNGAVEAVREFAKNLETKRSATPPVPHQKKDEKPADERGGTLEFNRISGIVDGRDAQYSRMRSDVEGDAREIQVASRNPGIDEMSKEWALAVNRGDQVSRVRLYHELNDRYMKDLGISRTIMLEGSPTGENPLSAGSGAELLPLPLAGQLIAERDKASKMRALVTTFPMTTQTQRVPVLPTMTAVTRAENAAYTDVTPTADAALLTATDLGVAFSAGRNMEEDSAFNLANQLTVVAGGAIGAAEDVQICTSDGTGSNITESLGSATITDLAEATPSSIALVDIIALYYGVPEQYRAGAAWFATGTTLVDIMAIADAVGRPLLLSGVDAPVAISDADPSAVGVILGHRVYDVPLADDSIFFGDPKWYALGNRSGIRVDTDRAVTTGARTWVIDERIDGRVIPTSAVDTNAAWRKTVY